MFEAIKKINAEAAAKPAKTKAGKVLNYVKRYYRGTTPKLITLALGSGITWSVMNELEKKFGK